MAIEGERKVVGEWCGSARGGAGAKGSISSTASSQGITKSQ